MRARRIEKIYVAINLPLALPVFSLLTSLIRTAVIFSLHILFQPVTFPLYDDCPGGVS